MKSSTLRTASRRAVVTDQARDRFLELCIKSPAVVAEGMLSFTNQMHGMTYAAACRYATALLAGGQEDKMIQLCHNKAVPKPVKRAFALVILGQPLGV